MRSLRERFENFRPQIFQREGSLPQLVDLDQGISATPFDVAHATIEDALREQGRQGIQPYRIQNILPGSGIDPGVYCETVFTCEELDRRMALIHAYGAVVTEALLHNGFLDDGQVSVLRPVFETKDNGFCVYKVNIYGSSAVHE